VRRPAAPGAGSRRSWQWHALDADWADRIVGDSPVRSGDLVLDLGAGEGALTAPLVGTGARVLAIELHAGRAERLRCRFDGAPVSVVEVSLAGLLLPHRPFRVVANPPFAHASQLVRTLLRSPHLLSADLVLQRGAVRGLLSRAPASGRRHVLSAGRPIPRRAFRPAPSVDSTVLQIRGR
jgi:23S rRNA (adenine-N6)-dimethyltransferase